MSAQPIWNSEQPSILPTGTAGQYYSPVQLEAFNVDVIMIRNITSNGSTITISFSEQPTAPFQAGDTAVITNVSPGSYDGNYTVVSGNRSQVVLTGTNTDTYYGGGEVSSVSSDIYFKLVAGALPSGIEVTSTGIVQGVPTNEVTVAQEAIVVGANTTSKFAIRAYTTKVVDGITVINRVADRTFTLTVSGQNQVQWITPPGELGEFFVGELMVPGIQLQYTNSANTLLTPEVTLVAGSLPPGLTISKTGVISGYIGSNPTDTLLPGFSRDGQGFDFGTVPAQGFDFGFDSSTNVYSFMLRVSNGLTSALQNFTMPVYSTELFNADSVTVTLGTTYNISSITGNGVFTVITYTEAMPYIPFEDNQLLEITGVNDDFNGMYEVLSTGYLTVICNNTAIGSYTHGHVTPIISTDPMSADNSYLTAGISTVNIPVLTNPQGTIGTATGSTYFAYQFTGVDVTGDKVGYVGRTLPPGLTLDADTGWLYGNLPNIGLTSNTYKFTIRVYQWSDPTVISANYNYSLTVNGPISTDVTWLSPSNLGTIANGDTSIFTVAAVSSAGLPLQYRLLSGSDSRLPQGLKLMPSGNIIGRVSFNTFALDDGTTTFDNSTTTFDRVYTFTVQAYSINGYVSVTKTFTITVDRVYDKPYENLYIKCMPPVNDRALVSSLLQNSTIFPPADIYRADDPNFGVSTSVVYHHAYGLNPVILDEYVQALELNHYWKNLLLGNIKTAQAIDPETGNIVYEVVYSEIIDNLVNNDGESVGKEVQIPYPINVNTPDQFDIVYPNSLVDMRNQVIDVVGQESRILPLWMLSKQSNGNVLGFTPAWVIAYTKPGLSGQIAYNIETQFGNQLNLVDYKADRYELDSALTVNWDPADQQWVPNPPESTTFDVNYHYTAVLQTSGIGYAVGDILKVSGTTLDGTSPTNDMLIQVASVNEYGGITYGFVTGTADIAANGNVYNNVFATTVTGSGTGSQWHIIVVPGQGAQISSTYWINTLADQVQWTNVDNDLVSWYSNLDNSLTTNFDTRFDGGSLTFNTPADEYTNTDAYDKYLLYPKQNILG